MKNIIIATKDECDYIATDLKQVSVKLVFNKSVKVIIKTTYADRSEQLRFNANDVKFIAIKDMKKKLVTMWDYNTSMVTRNEDETTNYQFDKLTSCILQRAKQDESNLACQSNL